MVLDKFSLEGQIGMVTEGFDLVFFRLVQRKLFHSHS